MELLSEMHVLPPSEFGSGTIGAAAHLPSAVTTIELTGRTIVVDAYWYRVAYNNSLMNAPTDHGEPRFVCFAVVAWLVLNKVPESELRVRTCTNYRYNMYVY